MLENRTEDSYLGPKSLRLSDACKKSKVIPNKLYGDQCPLLFRQNHATRMADFDESASANLSFSHERRGSSEQQHSVACRCKGPADLSSALALPGLDRR